MTTSRANDPVWQAALDWVLATRAQPPDRRTASQLQDWLDQSPAHRQAYEQAVRVWLLTGLLPPATRDTE